MNRKYLVTIAFCYLLLLSIPNSFAVETRVSGFGSLVGTTLLSDEGYWVKHPSGAGLYDNDPSGDDVGFDVKEESLLGLQLSLDFNDKLSLVAQAVTRGQDNWTPNVEMFYSNFQYTNAVSFKVGKFANPVYLFSDVMDTHYAFGWLRTPSSSYSLSANFIEGVSVMYQKDIGSISSRSIFYYGRSKKDPDPFLTELFTNRGFTTQFTNGNVDGDGNPFLMTEHKNDIQDAFGIMSEFYYESFTFHLAFMEAGGERDVKTYEDNSIYVEVYDNRDFYDIAFSYDDGQWVFITEWNNYVDVYSSYYVAFGGYIGKWQWLLTRGEFEGEVVTDTGFTLPEASQEFSDTLTLSLRYDYADNVALKAELVQFNNENSLIVRDVDGDGAIDSTALSLAIDFIF